MENSQAPREPFLFRFRESEALFGGTPRRLTPSPTLASNPKEEAPRPEPTKPGPWGD